MLQLPQPEADEAASRQQEREVVDKKLDCPNVERGGIALRRVRADTQGVKNVHCDRFLGRPYMNGMDRRPIVGDVKLPVFW